MRTRLASVAAALFLTVAPFVGQAAFASTFTIPESTCAANAECDSASVTMPAVSSVTVSLTSSQWTNASLAGNDVLWGIAYSTDGGTTWGPGTANVLTTNLIGGASANVPAWAYQTVVIGRFGRGGNIGLFGFSGGTMPPVGTKVRLFAWPQVSIPLGAVITVS